MIRKATLTDIPHLIRAVKLSEETGYELYTYKSLFNLDDISFEEKFNAVLRTEVAGHNLTYHDFFIYEYEGQPAGVFSFYKEGSNGNSAHIATGVLMENFSRQDLAAGFGKLAKFKSIQFAKTIGAYQLDSVSVFPEFRGQGIFGKMLKEAFNVVSPDETPRVEIQVWAGNTAALRAYEKEGFAIKETKLMEGTDKGRVLMANF